VRRRRFLVAAAVLAADCALAQPSGTPRRVGILTVVTPSTGEKGFQAFRDGLKERGHVEGRDIVIEFRSAEGRPEALPGAAAELAALKPGVIVAGGSVAVRAAPAATPDVPIVALTGDFTAAGFAAEFRRPNSGVTGVSFLSSSLDAKRLELLAELLPKGSAVLNPSDPSARTGAEESLETAGHSLNLVLHTADARTPSEIETAFLAAREHRVAGVNVLSSPFLGTSRRQIIDLAASAKLPAIYQWPEIAEEGGLMAYGPRLTTIYG
jgi:putative ABC transport system substrate-binding protein